MFIALRRVHSPSTRMTPGLLSKLVLPADIYTEGMLIIDDGYDRAKLNVPRVLHIECAARWSQQRAAQPSSGRSCGSNDECLSGRGHRVRRHQHGTFAPQFARQFRPLQRLLETLCFARQFRPLQRLLAAPCWAVLLHAAPRCACSALLLGAPFLRAALSRSQVGPNRTQGFGKTPLTTSSRPAASCPSPTGWANAALLLSARRGSSSST